MKNSNTLNNCCIKISNYSLVPVKFSISYCDGKRKLEESGSFSLCKSKSLTFPSNIKDLTITIYIKDSSSYWIKIYSQKYCSPCSMNFSIFGSYNTYKLYKKIGNYDTCIICGSLNKENSFSNCNTTNNIKLNNNCCCSDTNMTCSNMCCLNKPPNGSSSSLTSNAVISSTSYESFIRLYDYALFVTSFSVDYDSMGQRLSQYSGRFSLGFSRQIELPEDARNLTITFNVIDIVGEHPFYTLDLFLVTQLCFAVYGITIEPYVYLVHCN